MPTVVTGTADGSVLEPQPLHGVHLRPPQRRQEPQEGRNGAEAHDGKLPATHRIDRHPPARDDERNSQISSSQSPGRAYGSGSRVSR